MNKYCVTIKNRITGETKEVFVQADSVFAASHQAVNVQRAHVLEWESVSTREAIASKIFPYLLT